MRFHSAALALALLAVPAVAEEPTEAPPSVEDERIRFDVKLSEGGKVVGSAGSFDYREGESLLATGGVELEYKDITLKADQVRVELGTGDLVAEGSIVLDEGPRRLTGTLLEYDLESRTGRMTQARAFVDPGLRFVGEEIAKVGAETYTVRNGAFTSCEGDVPPWSIHLSSMEITLEEYARIRNARLKLKHLPIFYSPYILWPAKTDRASGFLVPKPGYSSRRGGYLGLAYYKTLGRSADATFYADLYTKEFLGAGTEVRWTPSERSAGHFRAYVQAEPDDVPLLDGGPIFDPTREQGDTRWKVALFHQTDSLWGRFRGVVDFEDYSDFDFRPDYERDLRQQSRPFIYSNAYLSGNFGLQSLTILMDQRERILRNGAVDIRRQLPEIEYRVRPTQIGSSPLYFSLQSALHGLQVEQSDFEIEYGRVDILPQLSIPLSTLPWLSAKLDVGGRVTHYTDSLDASLTQFSGESLTRTFPFASLEIVGPSFSRVFDLSGDGRFSKVKHVIEPRIGYTFIDDVEDQERISLFDEIDNLRALNVAVFTLANRWLAKPSDESEGGAYEIAAFELAQGYSFDEDQPGQLASDGRTTNEGPMVGTFRFSPSRETTFETDVTYNTLFNELDSFSFSGGARLGQHALGLTWFTNWNPETSETLSDQARLFVGAQFVPDKLRLDAQVSYDLERAELLQQRYFLNWTGSCYSLALEYRESLFGDETDRDYRFSFTLKNVGTFIDLNGGL